MFLKHFRADNIGVSQTQVTQEFAKQPPVQDCEAIRKVLTANYPEDKKKWSIMGQSFGGFCAVNYLSRLYASLCILASKMLISQSRWPP